MRKDLIPLICLIVLAPVFFLFLTVNQSASVVGNSLTNKSVPNWQKDVLMQGDGEEVNSLCVNEIDMELEIPSLQWVRENGYPVNQNGKTYGPHLEENIDATMGPDLVLASNSEGIYGYLWAKEMESNPKTPEEAISSSLSKQGHEINLYLQDGVTCIGKFKIGH